MTQDQKGGLALIAGSVGFIITMAFHPTGRELLAPGQLAPVGRLTIGVHGLALVCLPIALFGTLALSRRLDAAGALIAYGFGCAAIMIAALASGLLAPAIAARMADPTANADVWHALFTYNGLVNQVFALVYAVSSAAAIVIWSTAILQRAVIPRAIGIAGCVIGSAIVLAILSGHLRPDVHGFGAIVLTEGAWFVACGLALIRLSSVSQLLRHRPELRATTQSPGRG
jgi:hypothetical protein